MTPEHYDIIIIGAGLSGIGTASHIAREYPHKRIAIIERREKVGGTWDLFRYPGIRSDSDMASFGFNFKPWYSNKVLAKGGDIRDYVADTAREFGLYDKIKYGLKIDHADWSSRDQRWVRSVSRERLFTPSTGRNRWITRARKWW